MIDSIDYDILRLANASIQPVSISELTRPLWARLTYNNLLNRVYDLEDQGLLKTSKQRHYVFVEITKPGIEAQSEGRS